MNNEGDHNGTVLEVHGLTKVYPGSAAPALDGLDLTVHRGEIVGLLGPNGAGKTTAISIMSTLLRPTAGRLSICGVDGVAHPERVRRHFGVVPQELALFDRLSAAENLTYFGRMYGLRGAALKEGVREGLRLAGLTERADAPVGSFSGGMKRRANLAAGILHRPPLLFLDEPTVGVDAQSRHLIMESLARLRDAGVAMVYTTHYMEEARRLISRVAIIDRGKRLDCGSPAALIAKHAGCADLDDLFLRLTGKQLRDG
ncbi:ABC transporter ATP-binding protein [Desulfatitalea alkaliphila]|uniref:ABC transporter ATP-binding protein n=1 Tax=Desulfatitalea alkaliphila TaxID=2929485 RepID=A0AA41UJ47_9BACT|nr:ABC transporter ATP-binding protein [Desulfatitalea alkaliphila]